MHCTKMFSKDDLIVWHISYDAVDRLRERSVASESTIKTDDTDMQVESRQTHQWFKKKLRDALKQTHNLTEKKSRQAKKN